MVLQVLIAIGDHGAPAVPPAPADDVHGGDRESIGRPDHRADVHVVAEVLDRHVQRMPAGVQIGHDGLPAPVPVPVDHIAGVAGRQQLRVVPDVRSARAAGAGRLPPGRPADQRTATRSDRGRRSVGSCSAAPSATSWSGRSAADRIVVGRCSVTSAAGPGRPTPAGSGRSTRRRQAPGRPRYRGRRSSPPRRSSAPTSRSASTAFSGDAPVVVVSSTTRTRTPATSGPSIRRCMPCALASLRTTNAFSAGPGRVHHRRRHRIGAQRQPAGRLELPVGGELPQQDADQRAGLVVQGGPAQIDVVVGFPAGRQGHLAVHDGQLIHQFRQPGLGGRIGHRRAIRRGCDPDGLAAVCRITHPISVAHHIGPIRVPRRRPAAPGSVAATDQIGPAGARGAPAGPTRLDQVKMLTPPGPTAVRPRSARCPRAVASGRSRRSPPPPG